jgi:hypothetical protein
MGRTCSKNEGDKDVQYFSQNTWKETTTLQAIWEVHIKMDVKKYSNSSVYEQSVYLFSLKRDAQTNTCFFLIYEPIFAYTSSFLSQTDRCSQHLFSDQARKPRDCCMA